MDIKIENINSITQSAGKFIQQMAGEKIFAFKGEMGVGKTTFIKAVCKELGVRENVNSPTFSIVNEYTGANDLIIYHFDCYRIKNLNEAIEIGIEEYLYSGNLCFIEWPDKITSLLPDSYITVEITELKSGIRNIQIY
mgnify:CR=1 FL=1